MTRTICIDFDGVLHSYASGWRGADVVADPPTAGAIAWLRSLLDSRRVSPVIYSSRSKTPEGIAAMQNWLLDNGLTADDVRALEFPTQKPAAFLTIDDRAICFTGDFPSIDTMVNFKPWNKD